MNARPEPYQNCHLIHGVSIPAWQPDPDPRLVQAIETLLERIERIEGRATAADEVNQRSSVIVGRLLDLVQNLTVKVAELETQVEVLTHRTGYLLGQSHNTNP